MIASTNRREGAALRGALALLACASFAAAQNEPAPAGGGGKNPAELLVKRISEELKQVDDALNRASESDTAAKDVAAAKASHLAAIRDIEELIKQVKYQKNNNSSSGGGGDSSSKGEGLSGKPEPRQSDGSSAPKPSGGKAQDKPQDGSQEEQQGQPRGGKKPTSGMPQDQASGSNEAGKPPPPDPTSRFTRTDTDARWGVLPPKLQERLMNLHVDDVPERYRVWLEAYIHALNSREQAGSGK